MLAQPTLEKLESMRLHGMAQALREQSKDEAARELSFEDRFALLVDRQMNWRQNEALQARLRRAKLRANACVEDIDYRASRGLDKALLRSLIAESAWVAKHENVFVCGPTGVGKSYLACALAHKTCRDGYSAFYTRAAALFRELALARADGSLRNFLLRLSKIDVLVVDDWAMTPMSETERRDFWEICEDRCQARSLILTSQMPVAKWHEQIGDATVAEGILDRIVHRAHRIDLRGESLRKNPPKSADAKTGEVKPSS
jgi:DNA replication protein DnaC